jgi:y4mF family transcriptional regulator
MTAKITNNPISELVKQLNGPSGTLQEALKQVGKLEKLTESESELIRQISAANSPLRDILKQASEFQKLSDPSRDLQRLLNHFYIDTGTHLSGGPRTVSTTGAQPAKYLEKTDIKTPQQLGSVVKASRVAKKLTQQQLADVAGVGRRFIVECEAGKPRLEFAKVLQVAAAAGIDIFAVKR